jgi:hypothetical protein
MLSHNNYRGAGMFLQGVDTNWFVGAPYTDFSGGFIIAKKVSGTADDDTAQYSNALFTVKSSGDVGIGTSTPAQKLDVAGIVKANSFQTANSSTNGTTVLAYQDQIKKVWTTEITFPYTASGTYYFNLVFTTNGGGYQYELNAVTARNGAYQNFGTIKDSAFMYCESDGDFEQRVEGDIQVISSSMSFEASPVAFKSQTTTATSVNGTTTWAYHIVRYAVNITNFGVSSTGYFQVHLTTYGYSGNAPIFINA